MPANQNKLHRAVFLDRDGVINKSVIRDGLPYPPKGLEDFEVIPGVPEACRKLKQAGFLLIVATNQPDVGRGTTPMGLVEAMHAKMMKAVPVIDRIEVCYHPGKGISDCDCRKPKPGMLTRAARALGIDLKQSWMVGDRWRDIDCGHAAGCRTVYVAGGHAEELKQIPDFQAKSLAEAADIILQQPAERG